MRKKELANASPMKLGNRVPTTLDEYLDRVAEPALATLVRMRALIRAALPPEAIEVISYRMPAFKLKKILVWYAAFLNHCSLFPTAAIIDAFKDELKGYETSKGTIHFPMDKPLPAALIKKIVKARLEQSQGKRPR